GRILARRRVATPRHDYRRTLEAIAELVVGIQSELGERASVGVGTPGSLSPFSGRIRNANSVWLNGQRLARDLADILGSPVRIANDANCFALSEAIDGAGRSARCVFGVIVGTGTGGGVVVDGRLLTGPNRIAGEWGHNPLPWPNRDELPGPPCYCGKCGCIETFLSGPGLAADFRRASRRRLRPAEISAAADAGDDQAEAALRRYEDRMARALAGVINTYVFSDEITLDLRPPVHGDSSGVRGAAWLWPKRQPPP
ncbi:MAG: ROK family protein, partial [Acidihalobacter sp.]